MTLAIESGGEVKDRSKLPTDSTKKTADMGEGGVKNLEKLPMFTVVRIMGNSNILWR